MLGDVGDPELIRARSVELSFDSVGGDVVGLDPLPPATPGDARQACSAHQQLDLVVTDEDASAQGELGVDAPAAVDAVGLDMDLGDQVGQHRVSDRALRWRALAMLIEPGLRDAEDLARDLDRHRLCGHHFDGRVPPFGLVSSLRSSAARRLIASSASSSAIRFFAFASSAFSAVLRPG
jgi:hypothetical protein